MSRMEHGTDGRPVHVIDHIYIGDRNAAKAKGLLQQHGIRYVLNCTPDKDTDPVAGCPCFFEKDATMTYKRIPIFDNRGEDLLGHMAEAIAFIVQAKHYGSILVHCNQGRSRSGSFIVGYMMQEHGLGFDAALAQARLKRPSIAPNESFEKDLRSFDATLQLTRRQKATASEGKGGGSGGGGGGGKGPARGPERGPERGPVTVPGPPKAPARGPTMGPSIGPSMPPRREEAEPKEAIGPSKPPVISNEGDDSASIGPSMPPKRHKTGPADNTTTGEATAGKSSGGGGTTAGENSGGGGGEGGGEGGGTAKRARP